MAEKFTDRGETLSQKQQQFLQKLTDTLSPLNVPTDIDEAVTKLINDFLHAQDKMTLSEYHFRKLVEQAPVAMSVFRGENFVLEVLNEKALELIGRTKEQVVDKPVFTALPEIVGQGYEQLLSSVYNTGIPYIANESPLKLIRAGKEETIYVNFIYAPLYDKQQKIDGIFCVATEVTEQVLTRKKIEESEKKFQAAITAVEGIIWTNNAIGEMEGDQPGWTALTGQTYEAYKGFGWASIVHPDDAQPTVEAWNDAVKNKKVFEFEHRLLTKEKGWRLFSVKAVPSVDEEGNIQQWVGVHTDITEQNEADQKLAYRTALLEAHNEASFDGILLVDAKGKILSYNRRFVKIWNMPSHIVLAKDDEAALSFAMTQLKNPQQFIDKVKYLYEHPTETSLDELVFKDGKTIERYGYPVIGEDGTYYAWSWTFKDITQRLKTDRDLKNTKDQLELTFKNIPAGVYLLNDKGEMIYVNDKGAAVYGDFTPEDLLTEKDLPKLLQIAEEHFDRYDENGDHWGPDNSPAYISLTTGLPSQAVLRQINRATKEQRWHYVQGAPLYNDEGKVSMVLVTSTDITVQKNAEQQTKESEENFRTLANAIPQLSWMADAEGWIYWYNQRWYDYTGTNLEEMKGWGWEKVHHPAHIDHVVKFVKQAWTKNVPWELTFPLRGADGIYRWFLTRATPVKDAEGNVVRWFGTNTDIEEQKTFSEKLEEKVAERTKQLNEANRILNEKNIELGKMNKELEAFTYVASHDLQEPLRKIQTFANRISGAEEQNLSDQGKDYLFRMNRSAKRMQELIEDLLTFSRLAITDRKFERTDLSIIITDLKAEFKETIEDKKAVIESSEMCEVMIIPFQFRQLMQNLIGNALKFSKPDVPPRIIIKCKISKGKNIKNEQLIPEQEYCHITVSDNGIGFEQEYAHKIFEVFQRLHGKEQYSGTGIGLAIVKKIIENHNGIIAATGEINQGATFDIYIPGG